MKQEKQSKNNKEFVAEFLGDSDEKVKDSINQDIRTRDLLAKTDPEVRSKAEQIKRRGRTNKAMAATALLGTGAAIGLLSAIGSYKANPEEPNSPAKIEAQNSTSVQTRIIVRQGDSIYGIVDRGTNADPRPAVDKFIAQRGGDSALQPGEDLTRFDTNPNKPGMQLDK